MDSVLGPRRRRARLRARAARDRGALQLRSRRAARRRRREDARGFLDWLAVRGEAARPARMPVVFKLADTAREPVLAPQPVRMQVDARRHAASCSKPRPTCASCPGDSTLVVGVDAADGRVLSAAAGTERASSRSSRCRRSGSSRASPPPARRSCSSIRSWAWRRNARRARRASSTGSRRSNKDIVTIDPSSTRDWTRARRSAR